MLTSLGCVVRMILSSSPCSQLCLGFFWGLGRLLVIDVKLGPWTWFWYMQVCPENKIRSTRSVIRGQIAEECLSNLLREDSAWGKWCQGWWIWLSEEKMQFWVWPTWFFLNMSLPCSSGGLCASWSGEGYLCKRRCYSMSQSSSNPEPRLPYHRPLQTVSSSVFVASCWVAKMTEGWDW